MEKDSKILGIDLGGTNMRVGLVEDKKITRIEPEKIINKNDKDSVVNQLISLTGKLITDKVEAIGIGVPSAIDVEKGIVYDCVNIPSWKEVHLKQIMEEKLKLPVFINNDANTFALGEKYFGKGQHVKNMVGVIIGTGLGSGVILNNKLYSGVNCAAGEIGCIPFKKSNYEYYSCGGFFENEYKVTAFETFEACCKNDKVALQRMKEFGDNIGEMVKLVMYAYDPDMIVLGGSVSKAFRFFSESMWENLKTFYFQNSLKNLKIETSELDNIAILGAASLYYDHIN